MSFLNKKRLIFVAVFAILGFIVLQIPVAHLKGSKAVFTLFDALAPTAGAFLGSLPGVAAVFLMQFLNFLLHGARIADAGTVIRFIPPLFATLYFARKRKLNVLVPLAAIIAFNLNPVGRSVWYFSLYWLIPIACSFFHERSLIARSLGATFAAHSVGGALWIWFLPLPAGVWIGLIPVVAIERTLFAAGIAALYVTLTNIVYALERTRFPALQELAVNKRYVFQWIEALVAPKNG